MKKKSLNQILQRIKSVEFPTEIDMVVGIARGGIIPAVMIGKYLNVEFDFVWINFRNDQHKPHRKLPELIKPISFDFVNKNILLIEDRLNTGMSLKKAKVLLNETKSITTLAVNGKANISLFNEDCFKFPWEV